MKRISWVFTLFLFMSESPLAADIQLKCNYVDPSNKLHIVRYSISENLDKVVFDDRKELKILSLKNNILNTQQEKHPNAISAQSINHTINLNDDTVFIAKRFGGKYAPRFKCRRLR